MNEVVALPLRGGGGEPIAFARTITSHGLIALPPGSVDAQTPAYHLNVRVRGRVRRLTFTESKAALRVHVDGKVSARDRDDIHAIAHRVFRLDDDLAPFYAMIANDPMLAWAASGAGRLLASPTVFDDVVKTICTTNCAWSATTRMTSALVELGEGAFPDPQRIATTPERWFADVARMGYRGPYIRAIARDVVAGRLDLESLLPARGLDDETVEERLLELPGVGPYAAAHIMQLLGRHHQLILDSWTRPTYVRLTNKKRAADSTIRRAFARYGRFAGLAFWLFLTQEWGT